MLFFKANKKYTMFFFVPFALHAYTYQHNEMSCSLVYYGTDGCTCSQERREQSALVILDGNLVESLFHSVF